MCAISIISLGIVKAYAVYMYESDEHVHGIVPSSAVGNNTYTDLFVVLYARME